MSARAASLALATGLAWLALARMPAVTAAEPALPRAGDRLATALQALSTPQLHFLYSSQLVPDTLRVERAPGAETPLGRARELLSPFGLTLVPVGPGLYAVASAPAPSARVAQPNPAPAPAPARAAPPAPGVTIPPAPVGETVIYGDRHPFGLKSADDALLYSATRLGAQPAPGEDALLTLARMPGMSQGDLSGRLNIRGGGPDETLILLDGFPLRQPWHMPGYRGVLSLIDPGVLQQVSLYQGAIPARYGDRMSGVLDLASLAPLDLPRHSLGLGFLNARWRSDFALPGAGSDDDLLLAVRYGATGYLAQALQPAAANPRYGDVYGRLRMQTFGDGELVLNTLLSRDRLAIHREGLDERSSQHSASAYYWLRGTWPLALPGDPAAKFTVWLGHTHFESGRDGELDSPGFATGSLMEDREAGISDLRLRVNWVPAPRHALEAGLMLHEGNADYRYASRVAHEPALAAALGVPASNAQSTHRDVVRHGGALFAEDTWLISSRLTAQLGLRTMLVDVKGAEALSRTEPRLALALQATDGTALRASWGRVHQVRDLTDIGLQQVPTRRPIAQRTEYRVIGMDQTLGAATLLRVEGFDKHQVHLLAQQRNLLRTPSLLPELSLDRFWVWPSSTIIRGVEATVQQSRATWRWSAAWAWSTRGEAFVALPFPRHWESRQSGAVTLEKSAGQWLFSAGASYRGSLPTMQFASNAAGGLSLARFDLDRLPATITVDLRAKWRHPLPQGTLSVIGQVSNLFDHADCCAEFAPLPAEAGTPPQLTLHRHGSLPAIPWAGVSWDF